MKNKLLEVSNLTKTLGGFKLDGVSFSLAGGFIMGLIGPNGAGKTTTLKIILNMLIKDGGSVKIFGKDHVADENEIKEKIGVVIDKPFFDGDWKLSETEKILSKFYERWNTGRYYSLLEKFGLDREKKVKDLSRGMSMKLMLAAAMSHGAELLILDEPTSGLDAIARSELSDMLAEFICDERHAVLFSTHIMSDLEKTADFITFILNGKILYTGTKDGLAEKYCLVKGARGCLSAAQQKRLIGYREHSVGFDALAEAASLASLPPSVIAEAADLEEIMTRFGTGERL